MTHAPTFKRIFGTGWDTLPPVMRLHYGNRPYSKDETICRGQMDLQCSLLLRLLWPIFRLLGGIPAVNASNVPVTVRFKSDVGDASFQLHRTFELPRVGPYVFHSRMISVSGNKVAEIMKFRLCWRIAYHWAAGKVTLSHQGYSLYLFGRLIPFPITWLIGSIHSEEEAISDTRFKMFAEIRHWLFGKLYEYRGEFDMEPEK